MTNGTHLIHTVYIQRDPTVNQVFDDYCESFLDVCNEEGQAPEWAIESIFGEHEADINEFAEATPEHLLDDGVTILHWLGY